MATLICPRVRRRAPGRSSLTVFGRALDKLHGRFTGTPGKSQREAGCAQTRLRAPAAIGPGQSPAARRVGLYAGESHRSAMTCATTCARCSEGTHVANLMATLVATLMATQDEIPPWNGQDGASSPWGSGGLPDAPEDVRVRLESMQLPSHTSDEPDGDRVDRDHIDG